MFQKQNAGADLLREIEPGHIGKNRLVLDSGEIQHIGGHVGKAQRFRLYDVEVLRLLLRRQAAPLQYLGKACHRHDGSLELMGKIIDKIIPKHFRIAQLLRHLVEAVGELRKGRMAGEQSAEFQPGLKIPGGQTVHLKNQV